MPRKVRDANLETRTARSRLKVAHKPFFRLIEPGLHIGYRKLQSGPGLGSSVATAALANTPSAILSRRTAARSSPTTSATRTGTAS
jgi:hypothetical protein